MWYMVSLCFTHAQFLLKSNFNNHFQFIIKVVKKNVFLVWCQ